MAKLLGIDATNTVVRIALIRVSYRRVALEALGEIDVALHPSLVEAIRAAVGPLKCDAASIALSGERSYYRQLELPAAALKEIESVLGFELEATVPFELSEAVFDYRTMKAAQRGGVIPVFAALARAEDVRDRIRIVREAIGQEPERVGTGALPLANLSAVMPELEKPFRAGEATGPIAILEIDETSSDIIVLQGGEPVFARTLSRGTLGLPDAAPHLAREIRQTFSAWRALGGEALAGMFLVGGGASAQGAELYLSTELGVTILPLPAPRLEGITPEQQAMLPRFAKALGLALGLAPRAKGLNLRRGALEAERSYPFLTERVPLLAGLGAAIAVSFVFSIVAQMRSLEAERALLEARLAATSQSVLGEETTDPDKVKELIEQGPGSEEDPMPRADAFDVMVQLSKAVPKDLVHDVAEFDVQRAHATLQGTVPTIRDAETIAENMKQHRCMKDAKITRTTSVAGDKQKYTLEFDIKCETLKKKKPGPEPADSASAAPKPEGRP